MAAFAAMAGGAEAPGNLPAGADWIERLRSEGNIAAAKTELTRRAIADPRAQDTLFNLGAIHEHERDWEAAADFYERAQSADPSSTLGRKAAGRVAAVRRRAMLSASEEGREQLRYDVAIARASEARAANGGASALPILEAALRLAPERWEAPAMIGAILAERGETSTAANYLRAARRNAPAADRGRFDQAIGAILAPSRHLFEEALARGPDQAAATARLSREMLEPKGGERIKEASALLVARDVEGATEVLREAAARHDDESATAWRMLRALAPVSARAREAMAWAPADDGAVRTQPVDSILPDPVTGQMRLVASAPPALVEQTFTMEAALAPPAASPEPPGQSGCPQPAPARPVSTEAAPEDGHVVQVGAYRDASRAEALARRLASIGFAAEARGEGAVYRVTVGPFTDGESARSAQRMLSRSGFAGMVRTARP
jgi:cell division septation protein DedD